MSPRKFPRLTAGRSVRSRNVNGPREDKVRDYKLRYVIGVGDTVLCFERQLQQQTERIQRDDVAVGGRRL
jgi:hypothetical protein